MSKRRERYWNAVAAFGLALSIAGYLIVQNGALPKKKKVHPPATVEILNDTQS